MEAILRSVLLRQEQMEMQWDAEFEQQKQLFHVNTSTLIDMLPIQPRKKRLKVEGRVPAPSHDKENLVGSQGFVPTGTTLKSPKTKAPPSRGLAKRDLNTRFRDHDVKDVGRVAAKPAGSQPSLRNCLEAESPQKNASIVHAMKTFNQGSIGTSVRVEGDVGVVHVSPSTDVFLSGENRKRLRGEQEEDIVLQSCTEQNVVMSNDVEVITEQTNQTAVVNNVEMKCKPTKIRKGGKSRECAVEVEAHELSCRATHLVRCNAPEIVCKVEVEAGMETCRATEVMRSAIVSKVIEPEIVSKGPSRKGRPKGATTVPRGSTVVPEIVSKEPFRRGLTKQTSVPQVTQRVTRSRARMVDGGVESKPERVTRSRVVDSVVGSEPEICETMPCTEVVGKESAQQEVKLQGLCEAEGKDRSNQIMERQMETHSKPDDIARPKEIIPDDLRFKIVPHSKGQNSVTQSARKDSENDFVTHGSGKKESSHINSQGEAVSSHMKSGVPNVKINSRVLEIRAKFSYTNVDHLVDVHHEKQPQPQMARIAKGFGHRDANMYDEIVLEDGNGRSALSDAANASEEAAKDAQCLVSSKGDTLVEKAVVGMTQGGSVLQLGVTGEDMQACSSEAPRPRLSTCEAANRRLGKYPSLISNLTSITEISRTALPNIKDAYITLLSEVAEGTVPLLKKSGDLESLIDTLRKSSHQRGRISSVELSETGNDALAVEGQVLPTVCLTGRSNGAEFSVVVKNDSGEHPVGVSNMLATEQRSSESDDILDEVDIEANEERSRQKIRESLQDVVMKTTSEVTLEKEPDKSGNSKKEETRMVMPREHVKFDEVSPVRYSEARAIEEAMRCSLEQEFHPDVTLTLNRWQFRKRLSPRSKARARRWRSDVATNGVNYARGQSFDAPAASPSRAAPSRDLSLEGGAYEAFPDAQSPEVPVQEIESSFSLGARKTDDQADSVSQQEPASESDRGGRRSISSLCNEILSQDLNDREVGDSTVECEAMEKADEQNGNTRLPLLQSIYTLSKACQNDLVGTRSFLEEEEQQQVHSLIVSAKKIMEQLSSKAVIPQRTTLASDNPAPNNSRFHGHTSLYPDRFRLFLTPGSSPAATQIFPPSSSNYLSSAAPGAAGDMKSTSSQVKHLMRETIERAVSRTPHRDSFVSESGDRADNVANRAPSQSPISGKLTTTSGTRNNYQPEEGEIAFKSSPATGSGSKIFAVDDPIQVDLASDLLSNKAVPGPSTFGPVISLPVSQTFTRHACDGSTQLTIEDVSRQPEFPLGLEAFAETEKFTELRSRFYSLSKDSGGTSATAEEVPDLRGDGPESLISHSSNPPSPVPNLVHFPEYASEGAHLSVEKTPRTLKGVGFAADENQKRAVDAEEERGIPCSPIFIGDQRENIDFQRDGTSEPAEEPVTRTESIANTRHASMLRIEPQGSSNLISDVPSIPPSNSNLPRSNLVSSLRSFIPLVQQQQPTAPYPNGKRDVKVKALEAAEAAKRLAEQKEFEKQERKKAAELAKREKQERAAQEKLAKREKAAQEKQKQQESRAVRENEEVNKRKTVAAGCIKPALSDSNHSQGVNSQSVLLKVKKTHDLKLKMDQEKQERLLEEQLRKEEEWRKKEAENAARKRKLEVAEKKEREEKRRRQEENMKGYREMEERQRSELEKKTQKQKFMEELEKERRAIEEDLKRQRRVAKEKENEQRRKKEEEKELVYLEEKEAIRKRKEEAAKQMKLLEIEGRQQAGKNRRPSEDPAMPSAGPYHSFMASLHIAMGVGEGARPSGVNTDAQRVSSLVGHPLRVLQHSAEGAGALRNSQAALRVPRTTPESVLVASNVILGTGKPLTRTPPEALGNAAPASVAVSSGGGSTAKILRERINILQVQSGSILGAAAVVTGSKACQPGQVGFAGPPGGVIVQGDKGQSYEISPFRDSEDEDSEEEEKRSLKPIPQWARKENMMPQLVRQLEQDPDGIFVGANSCSLDEVFEVKGSKKRPDFKRRGSSGNWVKDCLTWQEQKQYKVTMGYLH